MKKLLSWTEAKLEFLWRKAEDASENDSKSLSLLRIIYGLFILFFATPDFIWIGTVPQSLFYPPFFSLGSFFNGFPNYYWLLLINTLLIICAICFLLGLKARYAGILFSLLLFIGNSFFYSFGKIGHSILFPVFILGLSFTNCGTHYALIPDRKVSRQRQRRVLAILAVLLCFGMFTAGYEKALNWIDFNLEQGGFINWFYGGFFNLERRFLLAPYVLQVPAQFFEVFDYFAVVFELSPFLALLAGKKWWRLWLFVACIFHLGNTLLLNIPFFSHAPVYLIFIPIASLTKTVRLKFSKAQIVLFTSTLITVITIHHLLNFIINDSIKSLTMNLLPIFGSKVKLNTYTGLLIWIVTTCLIGLSVVKVFKTTKGYKPSNRSKIIRLCRKK